MDIIQLSILQIAVVVISRVELVPVHWIIRSAFSNIAIYDAEGTGGLHGTISTVAQLGLTSMDIAPNDRPFLEIFHVNHVM
jgi:hypothetical protein